MPTQPNSEKETTNLSERAEKARIDFFEMINDFRFKLAETEIKMLKAQESGGFFNNRPPERQAMERRLDELHNLADKTVSIPEIGTFKLNELPAQVEQYADAFFTAYSNVCGKELTPDVWISELTFRLSSLAGYALIVEYAAALAGIAALPITVETFLGCLVLCAAEKEGRRVYDYAFGKLESTVKPLLAASINDMLHPQLSHFDVLLEKARSAQNQAQNNRIDSVMPDINFPVSHPIVDFFVSRKINQLMGSEYYFPQFLEQSTSNNSPTIQYPAEPKAIHDQSTRHPENLLQAQSPRVVFKDKQSTMPTSTTRSIGVDFQALAQKTIEQQQFTRHERQHWEKVAAENTKRNLSGFATPTAVGIQYQSNNTKFTAAASIGAVGVGATFSNPFAGCALLAGSALYGVIQDQRAYKLKPISALEPESSFDKKSCDAASKKFYEWCKKPHAKNLKKLKYAYAKIKDITLKEPKNNFFRDAIGYFIEHPDPTLLNTTQPDFEKITQYYQSHIDCEYEKALEKKQAEEKKSEIKQESFLNAVNHSGDTLENEAQQHQQKCIDQLAFENAGRIVHEALEKGDLASAKAAAEKFPTLSEQLEKKYSEYLIQSELKKEKENQDTSIFLNAFEKMISDQHCDKDTLLKCVKDIHSSLCQSAKANDYILLLEKINNRPDLSEKEHAICFLLMGESKAEKTISDFQDRLDYFKKAHDYAQRDPLFNVECVLPALLEAKRRAGAYNDAFSLTENFLKSPECQSLSEDDKKTANEKITIENQKTRFSQIEYQLLEVELFSLFSSAVFEKWNRPNKREVPGLPEQAEAFTILSASSVQSLLLFELAIKKSEIKSYIDFLQNILSTCQSVWLFSETINKKGVDEKSRKKKEDILKGFDAASVLLSWFKAYLDSSLVTKMSTFNSFISPALSMTKKYYYTPQREKGESPTSFLGVLAENTCDFVAKIKMPLFIYSTIQTESGKALLFKLSSTTGLPVLDAANALATKAENLAVLATANPIPTSIGSLAFILFWNEHRKYHNYIDNIDKKLQLAVDAENQNAFDHALLYEKFAIETADNAVRHYFMALADTNPNEFDDKKFGYDKKVPECVTSDTIDVFNDRLKKSQERYLQTATKKLEAWCDFLTESKSDESISGLILFQSQVNALNNASSHFNELKKVISSIRIENDEQKSLLEKEINSRKSFLECVPQIKKSISDIKEKINSSLCDQNSIIEKFSNLSQTDRARYDAVSEKIKTLERQLESHEAELEKLGDIHLSLIDEYNQLQECITKNHAFDQRIQPFLRFAPVVSSVISGSCAHFFNSQRLLRAKQDAPLVFDLYTTRIPNLNSNPKPKPPESKKYAFR